LTFCTTTRHFMSNSTSRNVIFKTNFALSRPLVDGFMQRLVTLRLIRCHETSSRQICTLSPHLVDIFARRLVTWRLIRQLCASTRPRHVLLLTIFARRLVILRLIRRHKTSFSRQLFASTCLRHVLLLTIFARLVILRLFRRDKRTFLTNLRIYTFLTRPVVDGFCTTTRHFTYNWTTLRIDT